MYRLLMASALITIASTSAHAQVVSDGTGDFVPTFTGPKNPDIDLTQFSATFDGATFFLDATVRGRIGQTAAGQYVLGFNRGAGTARFGPIATGVLFDLVVVVTPGTGTVTVIDLLSGARSTIPATAIVVNGNQLRVAIPANLLTPQGLLNTRFLVNLWSRSGAGGNELLADFAPDNSLAQLVLAFPTPEEASVQTEALIDDGSDRFNRVQRRLAQQRATGNYGKKLGGFFDVGARFGTRGIGDSLARNPTNRLITGGLDYALNDNVVLGVGFAADRTDTGLAAGGKLTADIYSPEIYLGWRAGGIEIDAFASYSFAYFDQLRQLPISSGPVIATALFKGHAYTFGGALGYTFGGNGLTIKPVIDLVYTRATIDGYTETNLQDFGAVLPERSRDSARLGVGAELRYGKEAAWGIWSLHAKGRAIQELSDKSEVINFAFTAQPTNFLSVVGPRTGTTYGVLDFGVGIATKGGVQVGLSYSPRVDGRGLVDHAARFSIGKSF